jgi:hypothetical protein
METNAANPHEGHRFTRTDAGSLGDGVIGRGHRIGEDAGAL